MVDAAEFTNPVKDAASRVEQTLQARVRCLTWEAEGVLSVELAALDGSPLPPFEPGAHVDLKLPNGTLRQYSLCGDPAERSHYRLGIREVAGGLSSSFVHHKLRPGDVVTISAARNNFPLVDAKLYIFVAGGIGVTPLIPMMRKATARGRPWVLLYCNKRNENAPFLAEIEALGGDVSLHSTAAGTRLDVAARFGAVEADTAVYCCGPERLMTAVEEATAGWPEGSVHFEWFTPRSRPEGETSDSFEVICQKSGLTVSVPADKSILEALAAHGLEVPRSCEQGICGTCECRVIAGEVDHRDSILSNGERATSQTMMICVSRARGSQLILDI